VIQPCCCSCSALTAAKKIAMAVAWTFTGASPVGGSRPVTVVPPVGTLSPVTASEPAPPQQTACGSGALSASLLFAAAGVGSRRVLRRGRARTSGAVALKAVRRACHGGAHLSAERKLWLESVVKAICVPGKGITATDEGPGTIGDRFAKVGVENTEENRRRYRQMLYETPGVNQYLSAAILDPETIYQKNESGIPFPEVLSNLDVVPGVKPHLKVYELPGTGGDTVMQGLDSLAVRCREYKAAGCKFAKWRSPLTITASGGPTDLAIKANMEDLARYALICQDEGLVPIVEPDIVMKGDHTLETAIEVNTQVQSTLYKAMLDHGVYMEGSIMKTNLVNPGLSCATAYTVEQIAEANLAVLRRVMPMAVPGVNFLSGGQSLENAAARLDAINKAKVNEPWNLSFSWSWAIQAPLFKLCEGRGGEMPLEEMGALYLKELAIAGAAALGKHNPKDGEGAHCPPKEVAAA